MSDEIHSLLHSQAKSENLTLTDYILSKTIPHYLADILTVDKVIDRFSNHTKGKVFAIPDLFSTDEWEHFTSGSRISTGRLFRQALTNNEYGLQSRVKFLRKNSANHAIYEKLTDN